MRKHLALPISILLAFSIIIACNSRKKVQVSRPRLPFPNEQGAIWIQNQIDSSNFTWYLDPKAVASAFCNEYYLFEREVSTDDITIKDQGVFYALAEIKIGEKSMSLRLERPFKERGENSIWQVAKYEELK